MNRFITRKASFANRTVLRAEVLEDRITPTYSDLAPIITPPTSAVAITLAPEGSASGTTVISNDEVDYFQFTATDSGSFWFRTFDNQTVIGVYDSAGTRIALQVFDTGVYATLTNGNLYYFGVTDFNSGVNGTKNWSILGPDSAYEDNDTFSTAYNLGTLTQRFEDKAIAMLNDRYDYYRFTTTTTSGVDSFVHIASTQPGNLDLYLYDDVGTLLARSTTTRTDETISLNGRLAGTYVVLVHGVQTNERYGLTIEPTGGSPLADDGFEENDSFAAANDLGAISSTRTLSGLAMLDNYDFYRFTTTQTSGLDSGVTMTTPNAGQGHDLDLYLYDANGNLLDLSANPYDPYFNRTGERIRMNGLPAGTYTVLVYGAQANSNYSLAITPGTIPSNDDAFEDNDAFATASDLGTVTTPLTISAIMADNRDFYKFTLPAGSTTRGLIHVTFAGGQGYPYIYRFDANGNPLEGGGGFNSEGEVQWQLYKLPAGTYYVMVIGQTLETSDSYTMTIDPGHGPFSDDRYEDNDTLATATNLGNVPTYFLDYGLTFNDGADYYRFTTLATGGQNSYVQITDTQSDGHLDLYLLDEAGNLLDHSTTNNPDQQRIPLDGRPAGNYYALVYSTETNPYYYLRIDPIGDGVPAPADDAFEDNDTLATAANLGVMTANQMVGNLVLIDRYDFYSFTITATPPAFASIQLQYSLISAGNTDPFHGDLDLYLFNSEGTMLDQSTFFGTSSPTKVSLAGRPAGTYVVLVQSFDSNPAYTLNFVLAPSSRLVRLKSASRAP